MYISTNLKWLRVTNNISQQMLSNAIGISDTTVSMIEKGIKRNPTMFTLIAITEYFKITIDAYINTDLTKNVPVTGTNDLEGIK